MQISSSSWLIIRTCARFHKLTEVAASSRLFGKSFERSKRRCEATTGRTKLNMNATLSLERYNQLLAPARERFETSPGLNAIRSTNDPRLLEAFLLYFCAIGAQMTEPVETWIGRAAGRRAALGLSETWGSIDSTCPRGSWSSPDDDCRSSVTGGSLELTTHASSRCG